MANVEQCGATGHCERCEGNGFHYHQTMEPAECEVCNGTGECPCIYDMHAHDNPCVDVMDPYEYQEMKRREKDPRFRG